MNDISIQTSRSGQDYALFDGIRLNSSYNPLAEAQRLIASEIKGTPSTILISGCTLGYLIEEIQNRYPSVKILCFFFHPILLEYCKKKFTSRFPRSLVVIPSDPSSLDSFISSNLQETDLEGLSIIEWSSSIRVFEEQADALRRVLSQRIREMNGSLMVTKTFGKSWIKNSFKNLYHLDQVVIPQEGVPAVVITGSGPSLTSSLDFLRENRKRLFILALTSSLITLSSYGITPDAAIATDPGFWASFLANPLKDLRIPLFIPLSAAVPPKILHCLPLVLLKQDMFYEQALLSDLPFDFIRIPPAGTVSDTALRLGKKLTSGPLFVAGIDLCYEDIHLHSRPHVFDILDQIHSERRQPLLSRIWKRASDNTERDLPGGSRRSLPFKTYAGWLSRSSDPLSTPVYRLNPSEVVIPGYVPLGNSDAHSILDQHTIMPFQPEDFFTEVPWDHNTRRQKILKVTKAWMEVVEDAISSLASGKDNITLDKTLYNLSYTLCVDDILHLHRLQRLGEHEKIWPLIENILNNLRRIILELRQPYEQR